MFDMYYTMVIPGLLESRVDSVAYKYGMFFIFFEMWGFFYFIFLKWQFIFVSLC